MTNRQQMFVKYYIMTRNASLSAIKAGYSRRSASTAGDRNMHNEEIKQAIKEGLTKEIEEHNITPENIKKGVAEIAKTAKNSSDRLKAYELLSKILGLFRDTPQHNTFIFTKMDSSMSDWLEKREKRRQEALNKGKVTIDV